jgi:Rps23 Pro-64 3,4-dihydroxylase Tpa1-like proline 4-hydroxylase
MNRGWQPSDGGALRIHQGEGKIGDKYTDIAPIGDRLVLFLSDMLHEVKPESFKPYAQEMVTKCTLGHA